MGLHPLYVNVAMDSGDTATNWIDSLQAAFPGTKHVYGKGTTHNNLVMRNHAASVMDIRFWLGCELKEGEKMFVREILLHIKKWLKKRDLIF